MDAQRFLAEFGHIANAPGGMARLRQMVLILGARGDFIEKSESFLECQLEELGNWAIGSGFPKQEQGKEDEEVLFAKVSDMNLPGNEKFISTTANTITFESAQRLRIKLHPAGTVIFPKIGGAIATNKRRVLIRSTAIDNNCLGITPKAGTSTDWLFLVLSSIDFSQYQAGTSVPALSQSKLGKIRCILPNPEEQSRIVAKIDELMVLCDKLEAQQQERRKLQNNLRQSTLQAVANANNPNELQLAWSRLSENFGKLFHVAEDLIDLNQCIKHLALKGLLTVAQPGETIPSSITDLTITSSSAVTETEMDWPIPKHWVWARCAWLGDARLGKMLDAAKNKGELRPYLRNINVRWGKFDLTDVLKMRVEEHELPRVSVRKGDLVICEGGEPGRAAIWEGEEEFVIQKALHRFRCNEALLPEYFLFCLEHDFWSGRLSRYYTGATIKHLTGRALCEYSIPLPPVEEQTRILSAANSLTDTVTNLAGNLIASTRTAEALAVAAVSSLSSNTSEPVVEHSDFKPQLETAE
jgi:type I restriction enzyme S subunit